MTVLDCDWDPDETRWLPAVHSALRQTGAARLVVPTHRLPDVARTLPRVLAERIEVQFLLLPIKLQRVDRAGARTYLTFRLSEAVHA